MSNDMDADILGVLEADVLSVGEVAQALKVTPGRVRSSVQRLVKSGQVVPLGEAQSGARCYGITGKRYL